VRACFRAADQMARFADFDAFFAELFAHYEGGGAWRAAPGARSALAVRRERRVVVASNFDHRLPGVLDALGLSGFDAVLGPGDLGAAKPDPAFFEALARRFEVAPGEALYAGDDPHLDLDPARRAGWHAVEVASLATLAGLADRIAALEREERPG
jgi:putative hydrolase of the HAD superfamily